MKAPAKPRLPKDLGPDGPRLLEADIERRVCEYAESLGWLQYKFTTPTRRSVPDRILFHPRGEIVLFIEFKRPGPSAHMTAAQEDEAARLQGQNLWVYCVAGVKVGKALIEMWTKYRTWEGPGPNLVLATAPRVLEDEDL